MAERTSHLNAARLDYYSRTARAAAGRANAPTSIDRFSEDAHEIAAEVERLVEKFREVERDRDKWKARAEAAEKQIELIQGERAVQRGQG